MQGASGGSVASSERRATMLAFQTWGPMLAVEGSGVGYGGGALAADDCGRFVQEVVVFERLDHEQGEVDAARDVAVEDGVADVAAPDRQALAGALLQAAAPHDGPARVAGEHASRRLDLVVEVGEAGQPGEAPADIDQRLELPRVDVLAVERDVPPAREHQPRFRLGVVQNRLRGPGRVLLHAARDEDDEDSVAARDGSLDDGAVVGRAGHDGDPAVEPGELGDALLAAHGDDLVAAVERVPDHVGAELARCADDADSHRAATPSGAASPGINGPSTPVWRPSS